MNLVQKISARATLLMCIFVSSTVSAQSLPNGTYTKTNFGAMDLICISSDFCFASYEGGKSFMYMSSRGHDNFIGYWAEPDADKTCPDTKAFPNITTNAWGNVNITFDYSGDSWTGFWGYCEEHPNREFNGARKQEAVQEVVADAGDLTLAEWLFGSWLPTEDSGAQRNDMYTFNPDSTYVISDGSSNAPLGTWVLKNAQLFLDGRPEPVPLEFLEYNIKLAGVTHAREMLNGEIYDVQGISGGVEPGGAYMQKLRQGETAPKVGDYALRYVVLGQADSFKPGASADTGPPVYVEFWNETEAIKEDEAGNGYRDDIVVFEATGYEVNSGSLKFHGYHPDWGDMYFSGQFDGNRVAAQTSYELGGGAKPANADKPIIVGDLLVKGHIFRDVELYLAFLH